MGRIVSPLGLGTLAPMKRLWTPSRYASRIGTIGDGGDGIYNGGFDDDPDEIVVGNDGTSRKGYFLFTGLGLPQGSVIISAYIDITAHATASGVTVNLKFEGSDEDDPVKPADKTDADGRPRTDAKVYWNNIQPWVNGVTYRTPDIKSIIQEIVYRSGFGENKILIFFEDNGSTSSRKGKSYKGNPAKSATLTVNYVVSEEEEPEPEPPGWWNPDGDGIEAWGAWKVKGAADYATSLVDLTGNGHDAYAGNAPGWNAVDGWVFNGTNDHLLIDFQAQTDLSQSLIIKYTEVDWNWNESLVGSFNPSAANREWGIKIASGKYRYSNGCSATGTVGYNHRCLGVLGNKGYADTTHDVTTASAWWGAAQAKIAVGAYYGNGSIYWYSRRNVQALVLYDSVITEAQYLAVRSEILSW